MKLWHLDAPVDTPAAEMMGGREDVCGLVSQSHCNSKELELLHSNKCRRQHKNQKQDLKRVANPAAKAEANLQTQNSQASLTCSLVLRALPH
jgi:hypothetical protein